MTRAGVERPERATRWYAPTPGADAPRSAAPRLRGRLAPYVLLTTSVAVVVTTWLVEPTWTLLVAGVGVCSIAIFVSVLLARDDARAHRELEDAAASLAVSEERFRVIVRDSEDITVVTDAEGNLVYVSPAMEKVLGFKLTEVLGTNMFDLLHPDDRDDAARAFGMLAEMAEIDAQVVRVRRAGGGYADVEAVGTNQLGNPAIRGIVITVRDISDRKRAEAQLVEAEKRFAGAFEHAPIGMGLADADGVIVRVNRALAALLDRAPDDLPGRLVSEITHPDDRELTAREMRRLFAGEIDAYHLEKRYLRSDGSAVWAAASVSLVQDAEGRPLYTIAQMQDATERRAILERLAHQAIHDPMTGLPNRVLFVDRLELALERSKRSRNHVAVIFLDLDHFKLVNDSLGHAVGDELLGAVATHLRSAVRPSDTVARFGGDEFTVLCEDIADEPAARGAALRLAAALRQPVQLPGGEVFVSASIGIALSGEEDTALTLLRDADTAMYRAKDQGRARLEVFRVATHERVVDSLRTSNALHRALERNEFEVHYQPVVEVRTGRVDGFEALLRWRHPERGIVMPNEFIPLAEESGLIVPVGLWVLEEACRQTVAWQQARGGEDPFTIAVNLSPRQLADRTLPDRVAHVLAGSGIVPDQVWLEITETALMHDAESAIGSLRALRSLGVHLSIDDFGTGYSSLTYLKRFPVEALKVDRSFVDGLGREPEDTAIVTAVVTLAHALGLVAIAEGLETDVQLAELLTLGCDRAQGYLISRAQPADAFGPSPPADLASWPRSAVTRRF